MTAKATRELLARHQGHRTVVRDDRTLRCLDCSHTLLLDNGRATTDAPQTEQLLDEPRNEQDRFGRIPCARCGRHVSHFYANGESEPVPHANDQGLPCLAPVRQPAPPRAESIAAIRATLAALPGRSRRYPKGTPS